MTIGLSLFLIAVGAILRFAVTANDVAGVDIPTVGVILLIVGVIGLILSLALLTMAGDRRRDGVVREREYRDPRY